MMEVGLVMVDIMDKIQKITEIGKSTDEKRKGINISAVFYIWDTLVLKYDFLETIGILRNFIEGNDLKFVVGQVEKSLRGGVESMEGLMEDYGIPQPIRPPADNRTTVKLEHFTDRFIFEGIFEGFQSFFPVLAHGFMNSTSPKARKALKDHLLKAMEVQDLVIEYGKLKGFIHEPPDYKA
jgi:hypothetical protein